ncbi:MAG: phasin family protein [Alphaproteobacteria bacterium]|nr:phasin family protein [Alphaproteobacteria bacterium]
MAQARKKTRGRKPAKSSAATTRKARTAQSSPRITTASNDSSNRQKMETTMIKGKHQFERLTKDSGEFLREGMESLMKSGSIAAKGTETLLREVSSFGQNYAEKQTRFIKEVMTVKSLNDFTAVNNKITQSNFDDLVSGATRFSELMVKVLTETAEPFNEQINKGMKKATAMAA